MSVGQFCEACLAVVRPRGHIVQKLSTCGPPKKKSARPSLDDLGLWVQDLWPLTETEERSVWVSLVQRQTVNV
jgi:hypothetical protein